MNLRAVLTSLLLFVVLDNSLSLAFPYQEYLLQPQDDEIFQNTDNTESWSDLGASPNLVNKRNCAGFPCMYTHLSAKAGRASLYRKLAQLIDDCVADPSCNPGRRKRSITTALKLLTKNQTH